jgi:hypothetical protein
VIADLDTLLTALHVELTDRIIPSLCIGRSGPDKPPEVTDAELLCLAGISDHLSLGLRGPHKPPPSSTASSSNQQGPPTSAEVGQGLSIINAPVWSWP